jgi:hypothetical protein
MSVAREPEKEWAREAASKYYRNEPELTDTIRGHMATLLNARAIEAERCAGIHCIGCLRGDPLKADGEWHLSSDDGLPTHSCMARHERHRAYQLSRMAREILEGK